MVINDFFYRFYSFQKYHKTKQYINSKIGLGFPFGKNDFFYYFFYKVFKIFLYFSGKLNMNLAAGINPKASKNS